MRASFSSDVTHVGVFPLPPPPPPLAPSVPSVPLVPLVPLKAVAAASRMDPGSPFEGASGDEGAREEGEEGEEGVSWCLKDDLTPMVVPPSPRLMVLRRSIGVYRGDKRERGGR